MNYTGNLQTEQPLTSLLVRNFMNYQVITVTADMPVIKAVDLFLRKNLSGAPVVDSNGKLVGIFSEKDCLKMLTHSSYYHSERHRLVGDQMSRDITTVTPETELFRVVDIFLNNPFRMLPVVRNGHIEGVVNRADCLRAIKKISL